MSGGHLSKEFFELVKAIGESRSKQEEDRIILTEVQVLKEKMGQPNIQGKKMREYMTRMVYVEMLGHDASFGYVHAVKQTHEKNILAKRTGYLTCNLCLHNEHELMLLVINTMQRDLNSTNHLEVCAALSSVSRLVNLEMVPAIFPLVQKLLAHSQDIVRKKSVMAMHRFLEIAPDQVLEVRDSVKKALCDPEPSVMAAALHVVYKISKMTNCKDLVPSLVAVLKQVDSSQGEI
jgi:AP-4 complex subunit epsilon-1